VPPPKATKKAINVNAIFDQPTRAKETRERTNGTRSILSPVSGGIHKTPAKPGFFATYLHRERESARKPTSPANPDEHQSHPQPSSDHREPESAPNFGLTGTLIPRLPPPHRLTLPAAAIQPYLDDITSTWTEQIQHGHHPTANPSHSADGAAAAARVPIPGLPTTDAFAALDRQIRAIERPFDDDTITLRYARAEGAAKIREARVGDIKRKFFERFEDLAAREKVLERERDGVLRQIDVVRCLVGEPGGRVWEVRFGSVMAGLEAEVEDVEKQYRADVAEAKREEAEGLRRIHKKVQEMAAAFA
jgi:hypothetical protein